MEYTNIISLVPQGEHFDPTAMNEGVWLTQSHLNSIEERFVGYATGAVSALEAASTSAQEIQSLTDQLNGAKQVITERDATIAAQAAEIAKLKAGPAAASTATKKEGTDDLNNGGGEVVSEQTKEVQRLRALRDN